MAKERIIGDYIGSTFKDFLILPGRTTDETLVDNVSIETDLAGVHLGRPFLQAAMRTVVGKEMALVASKNKCMPVAPRGLSISDEAAIVRYVKENEVKPGDIEFERDPVCIDEDQTLGAALDTVRRFGHSNIPVKSKKAEFRGIFTYRPIAHDIDDPTRPITAFMTPFKDEHGKIVMSYVRDGSTPEQIKEYMRGGSLRFVPSIDGQDRVEALIFMQLAEAYKVGAAFDTKKGWEDRAKEVVAAGADMGFIDTSDAYADHAAAVVRKYKELFPRGPPLCAGNIVTADGFRLLADAGADVIKDGMGSGSICTTNVVLGIGAPPFHALVEVAEARDHYARETGKYIPIIIDGGLEDTWDINVGMTVADAAMGGRLFAGCHESAGRLIQMPNGKKMKEYRGEGSQAATMASGDLNRYQTGERNTHALYQGKDALVEYAGHLKPVAEVYAKALALGLSHAGARNLEEFRNSKLVRLTEQAGHIARPHGVTVVGN